MHLEGIVVSAQPESYCNFFKGWRNCCYQNQEFPVLGIFSFGKVGEIVLYGPKPRLSVQGLSAIATADMNGLKSAEPPISMSVNVSTILTEGFEPSLNFLSLSWSEGTNPVKNLQSISEDEE